jgi:hypothetical protein
MTNTELAHYGVPGMKWGRRAASSAATGVKNTAARASSGFKEGRAQGIQAHAKASDARLAKNGEFGSNARIVGKTLVNNGLIKVGGSIATQVARTPKAKAGLRAATTILQVANTVKGIRDVVGVEKASTRKNEAEGNRPNAYNGKAKGTK